MKKIWIRRVDGVWKAYKWPLSARPIAEDSSLSAIAERMVAKGYVLAQDEHALELYERMVGA